MLPILFMLQVELSMKESQVNDVRANIETQQSETSKAKSELKTALENIEKLKQDFSADKTGCETESKIIFIILNPHKELQRDPKVSIGEKIIKMCTNPYA